MTKGKSIKPAKIETWLREFHCILIYKEGALFLHDHPSVDPAKILSDKSAEVLATELADIAKDCDVLQHHRNTRCDALALRRYPSLRVQSPWGPRYVPLTPAWMKALLPVFVEAARRIAAAPDQDFAIGYSREHGFHEFNRTHLRF